MCVFDQAPHLQTVTAVCFSIDDVKDVLVDLLALKKQANKPTVQY